LLYATDYHGLPVTAITSIIKQFSSKI